MFPREHEHVSRSSKSSPLETAVMAVNKLKPVDTLFASYIFLSLEILKNTGESVLRKEDHIALEI